MEDIVLNYIDWNGERNGGGGVPEDDVAWSIVVSPELFFQVACHFWRAQSREARRAAFFVVPK
jgi:hypothetical protein